MPFERIDQANGKTAEFRAAVADLVHGGIVEALRAPEGDHFMVIGRHAPDRFVNESSASGRWPTT